MIDKYVQLAREAIEAYVKKRQMISVPKDLEPDFEKKAGIFVSLHKKDGSLRGCIGTYLPTQKNIASEIINNAIAAATGDPRFRPVEPEELKDLKISVDVLSRPEQIKSIDDLNPKKYGIIVKSFDRARTGLLLPDIEGVDTREEQVAIACQKAGIVPGRERILLYRFTVERHK